MEGLLFLFLHYDMFLNELQRFWTAKFVFLVSKDGRKSIVLSLACSKTKRFDATQTTRTEKTTSGAKSIKNALKLDTMTRECLRALLQTICWIISTALSFLKTTLISLSLSPPTKDPPQPV